MEPLQRIEAAIIDGRCRTPRYIQKQLFALHNALSCAVTSFHQAIVKDMGFSDGEAWFEINMTMQAVKHQYEMINFNDYVKVEYSIAEGKSNESRRIPIGYVYIVPSCHSKLYSIVQPAAAAIAAGNCVVIEVRI